jgi:hypothetical protein
VEQVKARLLKQGLYLLGLAAIGLELTVRGFWPMQYYLWAGICELTGFLLVCALLGWSVPLVKSAIARRRIPAGPRYEPALWFLCAQAGLAAVAAVLVAWISLDFSFDGMGEGFALLGLTGRSSGCPAALMLLGTAIVMAWQTRGRWRSGWQYASLAAGMLFTSSIGWSRIDAAAGFAAGGSVWLHRSESLLVSACMMTIMSGVGLARFLPRGSDWIPRARRATPAFAGMSLVMIALVLIQRAVIWAATRG